MLLLTVTGEVGSEIAISGRARAELAISGRSRAELGGRSSPPVCSGCGSAAQVEEARPGSFSAPAPAKLRRGTARGLPGGGAGCRHTTRRISSVVERASTGKAASSARDAAKACAPPTRALSAELGRL